MISKLSVGYQRLIAAYLLLFFSISQLSSVYAGGVHSIGQGHMPSYPKAKRLALGKKKIIQGLKQFSRKKEGLSRLVDLSQVQTSGPSQPEMSSFKSTGTDNMVNLFTGDFSYNIPLLDVGGYPVNIFYDGGISMEQEASWVGLGWNINPGSINRNMRGVPDDFDGSETLVQEQAVKPNITYGVNLDASSELLGIDAIHANASLGVSINNYLGPSLDLGVSGNYTLFSISNKSLPEKSAAPELLGLDFGGNVNLGSRSGLTISPKVSITANTFIEDKKLSSGIGISTSFNSRNGIKALQLSEQVDFNARVERKGKEFSSGFNQNLAGTSITFSRPSYLPSIRLPITNTAFSTRVKLGSGLLGGYGSMATEAFKQRSEVEQNDRKQEKPLIGYLYYDKLKNNALAITDFTRFNDREVTPNTPIISVPQYTYDVFSVQGEGTGGTFRAYRNDIGYVRDNLTQSKDKSSDFGLDIGPPGHYGANMNLIKTPSSIGDWNSGNHLRTTANTNFNSANGVDENVYFRNPGENSILDDGQYNKIGGTNLVRFVLGGTKGNPTVEPSLQQFSKSGTLLSTITDVQGTTTRKKRSQVISYLNADEASKVGLEKSIRSYDIDNILSSSNTLNYTGINRTGEYRRGNHISEIDILEGNGKKYVYGIPVYNITQSDFTFSVGAAGNSQTGLVDVSQNEGDIDSNPFIKSKDEDKNGYFQKTITPAYAHSFLLTGLLSPEYVDVTGNGITEDDLGTAVKFNYTRIKSNDGTKWATHKWRAPLLKDKGNFSEGLKTNSKDDKAMITYGERESWYLHSIESKTMIAIFTLDKPSDVDPRKDGKGALDSINGGADANDHTIRKLRKIDLYNKSDLKKNGLSGAKPIKTVHFDYNYSLCKGTPDNIKVDQNNNGKLTLTGIWFSYYGQEKAKKSSYRFSYEAGGAGNPNYAPASSDRWGTYKSNTQNPSGLLAAEYPYSLQDGNAALKNALQENAGAWMLKSVLMPSGGQMDIQYESDDYAFVQNRRAARMMSIAGFGSVDAAMTGNLYENTGLSIVENDYVFINVPDALKSTDVTSIKKEILAKYLDGVSQLSFKLAVKMPKGTEYLPCYAEIEDYGGFGTAQSKIIWIKLKRISGFSPLSLTAAEFLREQLPGQAFPAYDLSDESTADQVAKMAAALLSNLAHGFENPFKTIRDAGKAKSVILNQSFVRLNDPDGIKYGGGYRVKSITLYDNWDKMTGQYMSVYGQQYTYQTTEVFNGTERTISSGVASYEPSIGGEENPFQSIVQVKDKLPLGPASYGAIEMPVLDAFFPAPVVGYSKVTVHSLKKATNASTKISSGIGKQVTEYYTAKDFPVYYSYTPLDPSSDISSHVPPIPAFFYNYSYDSRAVSQGFLVATNDMHGKMKSQSSYAENDEKTPISYTEYFYRNTGEKGLDEKFRFVDGSQGGIVKDGNMGIDIELMTDLREFDTKVSSMETQGQLEYFPVVPLAPIWIPFFWQVIGNTESVYRAVTTTKVINYHSIVDHVVVIDKGSMVSTANLVYDAETGDVVVTKTNNEFDKPIYNTTYPAWWAYSGMGPAYKNINAIYNASFINGKINTTGFDMSIFESGDVLYLIYPGNPSTDACASQIESYDADLLWAYDKNKDMESLTSAPDLVFLDAKGNLYNRSNVQFKIIRSGKKNLLDAKLSTTTLQTDPVFTAGGISKIVIDNSSKVVAAAAVEYKEKWQIDNDLIGKYKTIYNLTSCTQSEVEDCSGDLEKTINPYCKGLIGNFKNWRSMVFYDNRTETNPLATTNISQHGFLSNFKLYWDFNASNKLLQDNTSTKWVPNNQVTRVNARGMDTETKNALDIYTSAQYAYEKSLPIAITKNANQEQAFYEGFEDNGYKGSLNGAQSTICAPKFIDLTASDRSVVKAADENIQAHSGKYVLKVAGTASYKEFAVSGSPLSTFNINFGNDTQKTYTDIGYNVDETAQWSPANLFSALSGYSTAKSYFEERTTFTNNGFSISNINLVNESNPYNMDQESRIAYSYYVPFSYYITVPETGVYTLKMDVGTHINLPNDPNQQFNYGLSMEEDVTISTINGTEVLSVQRTPALTGTVQSSERTASFTNPNVQLCKGVYQVKGYMTFGYSTASAYRYATRQSFSLSLEQGSSGLKCYKDYTATCPYTTPIQGGAEMLSPVFAIPAGKKMLFSAWVKEKCSDPENGVPCKLSTYTNNKIQLRFEDGTLKDLVPSGGIIEGWQRYEGDFTVTQGSKVTLYFMNSGTNPVYFDDIRMHPFNANMKSYVYDDTKLRLVAELDENNYARFYEYDEEGTLIRTKAETKEGVKTFSESRSGMADNLTLTDHAATKYRTVREGNFSSPSTWEFLVGGAWTAAPIEPSGNSNIEIRHNITLDKNLSISTGGSLLLSAGQLSVSPGITLSIVGTADFNNLPVILHADPDGAAAIGEIKGTLSNATNVTAEYYSAPRRAWRLVTAPTTGQTINAAWQEGMIWDGSAANKPPATGYGTLITTTGLTKDNANQKGFDYFSSGGSSLALQKYDATSRAWVGIATTLQDVHINPANLLFIRGDRSVTGTPQLSSTILRNKGMLIQGNQSVQILNSIASPLVANPYPSSIDFAKLFAYGNNSSVIQNKFTVWDPMIGGVSGVGGYVTFTDNGSGTGYDVTPATSFYYKPEIKSGEGFFVYPSISGGNLEFSESVKAVPETFSSLRMAAIATLGSQIKKLHVDLLADFGDSTSVRDGVLAKFSSQFTNQNIENTSVVKLPNPDNANGLSIKQNNNDYTVRTYPDNTLSTNDTLYLRLALNDTISRQFKFLISAENFDPNANEALLIDNYQNTQTPISLDGYETIIPFSISIDTAESKASDRFYIIIKPINAASRRTEKSIGQLAMKKSDNDIVGKSDSN